MTWIPNVATTGQYQVYVRQGLIPYGETPARATNAPFTVTHAGGSNTVLVNHQTNQASWVYLGTYNFNAGTAGSVQLTDNANGRVIADAVRLEPLPYTVAAAWAAPVTTAGSYKLYVRYPQGNDLARDAKYFVTHAGGESLVYMDQRLDGGAQWRYLGTYSFNPGAGHKVSLPAGPVTAGLSADAMAWVPASTTIDYDKATWNPSQAGIAAGTYLVEVNFLRFASQGFASSATYSITHAGGTAQVTVTPPSPNASTWIWQPLGTYTFNASGHQILVSTQGMDTTAFAVDAVRFTPVSGTAPTVNLTSPTAGQSFTAPASIGLTASASAASGGTISSVAFYNGATLIGNGTLSSGTSASGTWSFTWSSVAQGTYSVTARATDNLATTTTSSAVQVTVNAASGGGSGPAAGVYFIEADHLNTPRRITNASQQAVWVWDQQEPFGNSAAQEQPTLGLPVFPFNPRFPGQYLDKETGLAYNYYRDYDSASGTYRQSDPIGLQGGVNTYSYVAGNSLSRVDPNGLASCQIVGILVVCNFGIPPPAINPKTGDIAAPSASGGSSTPSCPTCNDPEFKDYIKCDRLYDYPYTSMFTARMSGLGGGKIQKPASAQRGPCGVDSGYIVGRHWNVYDNGFVGTITSCDCCRDVPNTGAKIETRYRVF